METSYFSKGLDAYFPSVMKSIGKYNENIDTNIIDKEDMKKEIQDTDINNNKSNPALHIDVRSDKHDSDELNSYPSATFELNPVI